MSKIERALRKAEEDKRKIPPSDPPRDEGPDPTVPHVTQTVREFQPSHTELSESFRKIAARLKSCCEVMGTNDILFTSAISQEGKTTAAANCAIALAQDFNLSVCLVDCDLRNPQLSGFFTSPQGPSITDVLRGTAEIPSVIQSTTTANLSIVRSTKAGRSSLPLLSSGRLANLVFELRSRFDFVVFDSPPILPIADAVVLSKSVSGAVLVIEPGRTRKKHIEQILEQIDPVRVIGFIMNYKRYRIPQPYNYRKYYDYGSCAPLALEGK
ncbi:MAG: hypothetical protein C4520_10955 [Candidatus Abyssobacteria bacterium SURF_5]|uniref:non-specific protein-tyrosine kinase n=1 Tax=Abyssobacteria bacterium (strain SURF_5) TaxID=2093360 RepID=A0A3A4NJD7_ABYX5|nr:MAG: hypothetical protein C4520_10955 [Candidatus Abyssubacteria bacterium SURF_5]